VHRRGVRLIRPMIVLICVLISLKLLLGSHPALLDWL
jgi:hypothetical protein